MFFEFHNIMTLILKTLKNNRPSFVCSFCEKITMCSGDPFSSGETATEVPEGRETVVPECEECITPSFAHCPH